MLVGREGVATSMRTSSTETAWRKSALWTAAEVIDDGRRVRFGDSRAMV